MGAESAALNGTIGGFVVRQTTGDSNLYEIVVYGTAKLTITNRLSIVNCDFSGMTAGEDVWSTAGSENRDEACFSAKQEIIG